MKPRAGTLLPAFALTTQPMPRTGATTPAQENAPRPGVEAARHPEAPCKAADWPPETATPATGLTAHRSDGARATAATGGSLRTWIPGRRIKLCARGRCCGPLEGPRRVFRRCRHAQGVSYRMISAVAAPGTALPSVRKTPPGPHGTVPLSASRRDRHAVLLIARFGMDARAAGHVSTTAFSGWPQAAPAQRRVAKAPAWCDDERGAGGIPASAAAQAPYRVL